MKNSADKQSRPPKGLSAEARRLWRSLLADFAIDDQAGRLLLATALESFDRMREAQGELKRDGCTILDRWGQRKSHPASVVERDARSGLLAALRALKLDPGGIESGSKTAWRR